MFVAGRAIPRQVAQEPSPPAKSSSLVIGSITGEMFDARVYAGKYLLSQVQKVGAKCAGPKDAATIKKNEDIETIFIQNSCDMVNPAMYGKVPRGDVQTYASGPFATM